MRTLRFLSLLLLVMALGLTAAPATAQVSLGADVVSRYVWRGLDFGESLSIQPALEYSAGPLTVGTWASYSVAADGAGANEHDLYLSVSQGPFSVGITDYYFPGGMLVANGGTLGVAAADAPFFDSDSHILEPFVSFGGTESFPISLYAAMNVYNDDDNSAYLEASYGFVVEDVELALTVGGVPAESAAYGVDGAALTNVGLSAGKSISITDDFSLPVGVSYIINPYLERTYLVFGLSL